MSLIFCEIYKGKKRIGVLPCKFVKKNELCEEHLLMRDVYNIKPGYILLTNNHERFFVTDVRLQNLQEHQLVIFFETVAAHKKRVKTETKINISLGIAFLSLIVAVIALFI